MTATYDAIIVGAGHNGLVAQGYLARAGYSTISLDAGPVAGGGLATVEYPGHPGFLHNTHSFFHRGIPRMPWYRDLELETHGVRYIDNDLYVTIILKSGQTIEWWTDFDKTYKSFERLNANDARKLWWWRERFISIARDILGPESQSIPIDEADRRQLLEKTDDGRLLLELSAISPLEFVTREFEDPAIQAGLLFINGMREIDLRAKGFGHHIAALFATPAPVQTCVGGAASLARALVKSVESSGGEVRTNAPVKRLLVADGRARGVELADGTTIMARKLVASSLNPHLTFLELLDPAHLPAHWREKVQRFKYNVLGPLFALHLNLEEPPIYRISDTRPWVQESLMVIMGLDHIDNFTNLVDAHARGKVGHQILWGSTPTLFDPSQAPDGKHTAFMWEKTPFALDGDAKNWRAARDPHGETIFDLWCEYAPNLKNATLARFSQSPLDTEENNPNMREADVLMGAFANGQVGINRPFPGAGQYRSFIDGLYLCGSASHPGGNITGLPGFNAAKAIIHDTK